MLVVICFSFYCLNIYILYKQLPDYFWLQLYTIIVYDSHTWLAYVNHNNMRKSWFIWLNVLNIPQPYFLLTSSHGIIEGGVVDGINGVVMRTQVYWGHPPSSPCTNIVWYCGGQSDGGQGVIVVIAWQVNCIRKIEKLLLIKLLREIVKFIWQFILNLNDN